MQPISLKTHEETKEEVEEAVSALASILEETPTEGDFSTSPAAPLEMTEEPEPAPVIPAEVEESPGMANQVSHDEAPVHRGKKVLLWTLIALCVVLLLAAAALAVAGRVAPEWLDSFLYSPEELEVLYK